MYTYNIYLTQWSISGCHISLHVINKALQTLEPTLTHRYAVRRGQSHNTLAGFLPQTKLHNPSSCHTQCRSKSRGLGLELGPVTSTAALKVKERTGEV